MQDWVKTVPKAVLHDHLDGGLRVETLIELANEQNYQNLPSTSHDELKKKYLLCIKTRKINF